jgi:pectinesterase
LVDGDDFIAQNLTIQNTAGEVGQAVALHLNSNRAMFVNCSFLGNQDTVYLSGDGAKNYFKNCYIEGTTDFIFGEATVLFENCVIHSKKDSFITAASTPQNTAFGFVFKECKLTADDGVTQVYLGRPWRIYAKTVFMNCEMGNHIIPEAWGNWSKPEAEKTTFFAEYNGKGPGFQPQKRVRWSFQLTASQAQEYSNSTILGDLFYENCIAFLKDVESNKYIK